MDDRKDDQSASEPLRDHPPASGAVASSSGSPQPPQAPASPSTSHHAPRMPTRLARRPRSLPRVPYASDVSSIFGSASSPLSQEEPRGRSYAVDVSLAEQGSSSTPPPPLSTLRGSRRQKTWLESDERTRIRRLPQVEKDVDDPSDPLSPRSSVHRQESTTLTTLSRLFAVQTPISPEASRTTSYVKTTRFAVDYPRNLASSESAPLPDHLYTRGLLEGRHSDIIVNAFGNQYRLHRLVLDRAPFFRSALSEPWLEAHAKETTLHPEDIDTSITQASFELALKRLYGCANLHEEDADPISLFTTGCWLEMRDLIDSAVESILRQMTPGTLAPLIKLVTSNYYGRAGDKILASAKAMLCRDGWRMPLRFWDNIPGDIIREIVGGDGFFIDGEWDRWVLAKRILDRALRRRAREIGLTVPGPRGKVLKAPDSVNLMAVRFDGVYRRNSVGTSRGIPDYLQRWVTLYTHADVEPILVLLDEGIHYIHLDFEQLQNIRRARDVVGLPVMPEKVISAALWQQMELRQKVMNAAEVETELGISVICAEDGLQPSMQNDTTMSIMAPTSPPAKNKGKAHDTLDALVLEDDNMDSGSWDGNGKPRKFWIPSSDCNIVMGGNADPVIATSNNTTLQRHASRLSATIQPEDVQWASDFSAVTSQPRPPTDSSNITGAHDAGIGDVRYTHFPPFRFAAEFPNPRMLKEKKRVYSRTVFYAGSLWNIYIQKVASTRTKQLGVYLHRAKERETEEVIAGTAGLAQGSVDERIGQLEREMILRSERHERHRRRRATAAPDAHEMDGAESSGSADPDGDATLIGASDPVGQAALARASAMRDILARGQQRKSGQTDVAGSSYPDGGANFTDDGSAHNDLEDDDFDSSDDTDTENLITASKRFHVPTLPAYVDARPTIRTYFKIYSPSRGGRMLSVYESAPDQFNFSQSWGWKSSTLMLDEGLLGDDGEEGSVGTGGEAAGETSTEGKAQRAAMKGKGDGKLRFMVVIGNI